jgi:hypothetical protein
MNEGILDFGLVICDLWMLGKRADLPCPSGIPPIANLKYKINTP